MSEMMNRLNGQVSPCPWHDSAELFLLGALAESEHSGFQEHLGACAACRGKLESGAELVARLDQAVLVEGPLQRPSTGLRDRVLGSLPEIQAEPAAPEGPSPPYALVPDSEEGWQETGVDGVQAKALFKDEERRTLTVLVRMAPGSSYPSHRHADREECYVISGDLGVGDDDVMQPGDYQVAEAGSVHPVQWTRGGCTLFIVSSMDDEILETA